MTKTEIAVAALSAFALAYAVAPQVQAANHSRSPSTATRIVCGEATSYEIVQRPRDCFLGWPDLPMAEVMSLQHTTWSHWGARTAPGHAKVRQKTYDPWTDVRVLASGRRQCGYRPYAYWVYTRVRVSSRSAGRTWRHTYELPGCSAAFVDD